MAQLSNPNISLEETELETETLSSHTHWFTDHHNILNLDHPFFDSDSVADSDSDAHSDSGLDSAHSFNNLFDRQSSEFSTIYDLDSYPSPGFRPANDFDLWDFEDYEEEEGELGLGLGFRFGSDQQRIESGAYGLRVAGIDSDSDSEDGVVDLDCSDNSNDGNNSGRVEGEPGHPAIWDSLFGDENVASREELEWEEVNNLTHETDNSITVFERLEEVSVPSRVSPDDDHEPPDNHDRDLDWQVLLAVHNVDNYIEQEEGVDINTGISSDNDHDFYQYFDVQYDDEVNYGDYDDLFGQMVDDESAIKGSPPAATRVVEDLPVVEFTREELRKGSVVCAVCKEEIVVEEKVRKLPCWHYYHGECILPWLGIRNTCPVCRYELPTDDPEYERNRRRQRGGGDLARETPIQI